MSQYSDERGSELRDLFFETAQELLQSLNEDALKLERNPQLAADTFKFTPPKGADVIGG